MKFSVFDGQLTKQEREVILRDFEGQSSSLPIDGGFVEEVSVETMLEEEEETKKRKCPTSAPNAKKLKTMTSSKYPKILLVSLRAGGVGLNLTSANVVFMCDPWWNEAVENQAINRVFRIGQSRKVLVYRLIIQNSIEEKILKLQEKKELLIQSTLDFHSTTTIKLTVDEIAALLQ